MRRAAPPKLTTDGLGVKAGRWRLFSTWGPLSRQHFSSVTRRRVVLEQPHPRVMHGGGADGGGEHGEQGERAV